MAERRQLYESVSSPVLGRSFLLVGNADRTELICPFDETPLVFGSSYHFQEYVCLGCNSVYPGNKLSQQDIDEEGKKRLKILSESSGLELQIGDKELILRLGREKGLI